MKILIIQQKMIGDVLTSSILFEALRFKYPNAQLHYLINEHTFPVVQNNPFIDHFIFFTPQMEASKIKLFNLAKTIRKEKFDIVIDVYSKLSSNFISALSGAKIKISKYKWYTSLFYTHNFKENKSALTIAGLAIENRLKLLQPVFQVIPQPIQPKIYLTNVEINDAKTFLLNYSIDFDKPLFMISVLGSSENKTYPLNYMSKIIDTIVEETNAQILFNYIPEQKKHAEKVFNLCRKNTQNKIFLNVFGHSLRQFFAITHHCNALIGNEGGAINMAKALNIKTFSIFSPWINKAAWNLFENKSNQSVHLKDYHPEAYKRSKKDLKKEHIKLYHMFVPELFLDKMKKFLKEN